jgi:hypothetical protein
VLVAGLVGVLPANLLAPAELDAWGWRVAPLPGAVIVPSASDGAGAHRP